ncbi:hypothetical protein lerEdw1_020863 [Lerista edwardsae]|nr:hypothetical protein lerEdw1_020863 [Lerista edwardsae]
MVRWVLVTTATAAVQGLADSDGKAGAGSGGWGFLWTGPGQRGSAGRGSSRRPSRRERRSRTGIRRGWTTDLEPERREVPRSEAGAGEAAVLGRAAGPESPMCTASPGNPVRASSSSSSVPGRLLVSAHPPRVQSAPSRTPAGMLLQGSFRRLSAPGGRRGYFDRPAPCSSRKVAAACSSRSLRPPHASSESRRRSARVRALARCYSKNFPSAMDERTPAGLLVPTLDRGSQRASSREEEAETNGNTQAPNRQGTARREDRADWTGEPGSKGSRFELGLGVLAVWQMSLEFEPHEGAVGTPQNLGTSPQIQLRTRLLVTVVIGGGILAGWLYLRAEKAKKEKRTRIEELKKLAIGQGDFRLVDHTGRPCSKADLKGSWVLLYFGFTHCPDICPEELEKMSLVVELLDQEARLPRVQPVFITVDPERDDVEAVAKYVQEFHPRLVGLTGSPEQVREAGRAYRVYYSAGPKDQDNDYIVDHTVIIYLLSPDGLFMDYYNRYKTETQMVDSIKGHMDSYKSIFG